MPPVPFQLVVAWFNYPLFSPPSINPCIADRQTSWIDGGIFLLKTLSWAQTDFRISSWVRSGHMVQPVRRKAIEAPCIPPSADLKCKEVTPSYCSSLANPVRLRRTTGNALALLNFPKGSLFNGASWSIFKVAGLRGEMWVISALNCPRLKCAASVPHAAGSIECGYDG